MDSQAQYGVSDSWSVREIIKAEREQNFCTTCSGEPCEKPVGKTFDDYEITADNQRAVKLAKAFVKCKPSAGLYIFGGYGTGKTFLASIIAQNPLEDFCNCDLLILDDIGAGQITEWNVGQLYQIINARYNAELPVIITSNLDFDGLKKTFGNSTGDRIISRLSEICTLAFLGTNDRRFSS